MNDRHAIEPTSTRESDHRDRATVPFDIERELVAWRRAFERDSIYSSGQIEELGEHLLDRVEDGLAEGLDHRAAFHAAVLRVGDARRLRPEYLKTWKDRNPVSRYFRRLWREVRAFRSVWGKASYLIGRITSLVMGLAGLFLFLALFVSIAKFLWPFWDIQILINWPIGLMILNVTGLMWFNLIPFRSWSSSTGDWVRLMFAFIALIWFTAFAISNIEAGDFLEDLRNATIMYVLYTSGPVLWLLHTLRSVQPCNKSIPEIAV